SDDDEPRVDRLQRLRGEIEALEHARPEALDERVGGLDEPQQHLAALRLLEVERHRALVAPDPEPPGRAAADELAHRAGGVAVSGPFDLDHLGAEIGEVLPDARACDDVRELDDPKARKGKLFAHPRRVYYPGSMC